jgi:hypothetical protein
MFHPEIKIEVVRMALVCTVLTTGFTEKIKAKLAKKQLMALSICLGIWSKRKAPNS